MICTLLILTPLLAQNAFSRKRTSSLFWFFMFLALAPLLTLRILSEQSVFMNMGVAFATVKSLGLVLVAYVGRKKFKAGDVALMIYFFPLFTIGPVEKIDKFTANNFSIEFNFRLALEGIYRGITGLFLVIFVCENILNPLRTNLLDGSIANIESFTRMDSLLYIVLSFLYTYINFEGFSSIAIGLSRLFGIKVMENFDKPLMVSNISSFWRKYHISMGNWINQTIYFPLVVWIKTPWATYLATLVAFILFGMWHAFTINYFIWGVGNGLAVASVNFFIAKKVFPLCISKGVLARFLVASSGGVITIIYVAWLQTIANLDSVELASILTGRLIFGN